ncbi:MULTISPECIES: DUF2946 domain-containing protein [unclassified Acinetobacter]|uniref:DUF2946 domain-containing protein n=1 Tax=unclassified Acinetobacter TaxID=196816 RepID=UPI0029351684|nr:MULTISPECIES: DUF2946 domain-containing protein [unclassified Acinetobacter]WOE30779.1 DUF2946 domain-containing protein [Acinetobacter sp. SAAs470]WOE38972.1 DUF2946 domain-containing protein [Acinetobacter sp. SAAs474]
MLRRSGLYLALVTLLLQIAVYLQPLLPEKYHIAPVCMSITHNLLSPAQHQHTHSSYHELVQHLLPEHHSDHNQHNHQCQYCTVYGDLVLPFKFGVDEVLDRIQVRLSFYQQSFWHVYFSLQKLYLLPQGRAPPIAL